MPGGVGGRREQSRLLPDLYLTQFSYSLKYSFVVIRVIKRVTVLKKRFNEFFLIKTPTSSTLNF